MRDMDINSWSQAFYARHGRYQVMIAVGVIGRKLDSWIVVAQIDSHAVGANFDNCEASRSKLLHGYLGAMPLWHEGRSCFPLQISETSKHSSFLSWMEVEYVVLKLFLKLDAYGLLASRTAAMSRAFMIWETS